VPAHGRKRRRREARCRSRPRGDGGRGGGAATFSLRSVVVRDGSGDGGRGGSGSSGGAAGHAVVIRGRTVGANAVRVRGRTQDVAAGTPGVVGGVVAGSGVVAIGTPAGTREVHLTKNPDRGEGGEAAEHTTSRHRIRVSEFERSGNNKTADKMS